MAFLAPIVSAVTTFLPVISTGLSVLGALRQGKEQQQIANYNAALAQRQGQEARTRANVAQQSAQLEADIKRREARRRLGTAQTAFGAGGLLLTGSATDVLADLASNFELDARLSEYEGEIAKFEGASIASSKEGEASLLRQQGKSARTSSLLSAGGTLLTAATPDGSLYDFFSRRRTATSGGGGTSPQPLMT